MGGADLRSRSKFIPLSEPRPISMQEWPENTIPLVSILCFTHNHADFVAAALEGFLAQETTFPVELIVHDDASTDATASIIAACARKHPGLVRTLFQLENQYSRGKKPMQIVVPLVRGEYIALCEGDDYWTSPDKLDVQVRLLEMHPGAPGCIHRADGRFEPEGKIVPGLFGPDQRKSEYNIDDLLIRDNFVPTASIVLRSAVYELLPSWFADAPHGDLTLLAIAAMRGPLLYIDRSMSVYRKHPAGIHSGQVMAVQALRCIDTLAVLAGNLPLVSRSSFRSGFQYRLTQIENEVARYEQTILSLERLHAEDTTRIQTIFQSSTFRIGLALSRLRDRLRPQKASDDRSSHQKF